MIHTVFISYNRLELTKQAVESYLATVRGRYSYVVVDNGSMDGAAEWLCDSCHPSILLGENRYPGFATNVGWDDAPPNADLLHRADNDFIFLPDWTYKVDLAFAENPRLGQLGLRTDEEELHNSHNTGGNCVVRREMFAQGVRYDERPWTEFVPGYTEDSDFSPAVIEAGWEWARVTEPCIQPISREDPNDDYYVQTWKDRRIRGYSE